MTRGRPPALGVNRDEYVRFRVSKGELKNTDAAAAIDGKQRSDYIRAVIAEDVRKKGLT